MKAIRRVIFLLLVLVALALATTVLPCLLYNDWSVCW